MELPIGWDEECGYIAGSVQAAGTVHCPDGIRLARGEYLVIFVDDPRTNHAFLTMCEVTITGMYID